MRDSTTTSCLLFSELFDRPLTATFDVPNASSDGGAVLLKAADRRLGSPTIPCTSCCSGAIR